MIIEVFKNSAEYKFFQAIVLKLLSKSFSNTN